MTVNEFMRRFREMTILYAGPENWPLYDIQNELEELMDAVWDSENERDIPLEGENAA
jgi:hypothetical protein